MITSVLIVLKHLIYGGTEKYALNLANSLAEKGIQVTLISGDGPLKHHVSTKVALHIMPISRNPRVMHITEKKIVAIAQQCKPQVIHTQCRTAMLNSQLTRNTLRIPLVTHEHHMYPHNDYQYIIDELKNGADKIITIGPYTAKKLVSFGINKENIIPIVNGIDISTILPITDTEREEARSKFHFSPSDQVILCISRLEYAKGIGDLAQAFIKIVELMPQAKLVIVGDDATGGTKAYIEELIKEYHLENKLYLLPGNFNIRQYHAIADVFCYPALVKGMAVMEAMAAGLPVVGKKTTLRPLVVEHRISGLMTDPSPLRPIDPEEITEKLVYLLNHPEKAKKMGEAARMRIEKKFTLEKVIDNVLNTYRDTVRAFDIQLSSQLQATY